MKWMRCKSKPRYPETPDEAKADILVYSRHFDWGGTQYAIVKVMDFYYHDPERMDPDEMGTDTVQEASHWCYIEPPTGR